MKSLDTIDFIMNAIEDFCDYLDRIRYAETYDEARAVGNTMNGYMNCVNTMINTMDPAENHTAIDEMEKMLGRYTARMYNELITKAIDTNQGTDIVESLSKARREYIA